MELDSRGIIEVKADTTGDVSALRASVFIDTSEVGAVSWISVTSIL